VIPDAAKGGPIEIWFQDEARIGQKGTLAYVWARQGTRPRAVQDTRYASAYLFGAVCPQRGVGAGLVMPRADTEGLNAHLIEIARTVAPGAACRPDHGRRRLAQERCPRRSRRDLRFDLAALRA